MAEWLTHLPDAWPSLPQTREQLQSELSSCQAKVVDLEKALAEQGQVTKTRFGAGSSLVLLSLALLHVCVAALLLGWRYADQVFCRILWCHFLHVWHHSSVSASRLPPTVLPAVGSHSDDHKKVALTVTNEHCCLRTESNTCVCTSADAELWETLLELQQFHVFTVCFFVCWAVLWLCFSACSLCSVVLFCCWAVFLALPVTVKSVRQWKQLFHLHLIWINKAELLSLSPPVGVCLLLLLWLCEADSVVVQCVGVLHRLVVLLTTLSNALVTSCWCPVWLLWQDSKWVEEKQYLLRTNQELHEKVDDDNLCASHTFLE